MPIADFSGRVRPDACPGALQVHEAADGPLARVRLPGGAVSVAQLHELASCAAELGTGVLELTSRANVQVRGLSRPEVFAGRIASVGLLPSPAHERVRNIVASPLSGRGPVGLLDVLAPADALDRALCARPRLAGLPGRFLFALDDGTGDVIGLGADVTFAATGPRDGRLLLAGTDTGLTTGPGSAIPLMIRAAEAFLDERPGDAPRAWRVHELANGPARITARLRGDTPPPASSLPGLRPPAAIGGRRAGRVAQWDGRVAVEAVVPLGRLTPAQARTLADAGHPVRLTPWRTAVLLDLSPAEADRATKALDAAGLVTDPDSPWSAVTACTGRPGCAKALADVRADARRWVESLAGVPGTPVHWAGCERRCGLPRGRVVQMIATTDGYEERQE
ncbi:precorrin-3B synthase [Nonomuraea antimicrobica]|uniref:precorrin-3B synthase n=1 Tax=Nonomuraea antimicrobica TaxID=561173 RepID=UPI0031ED625C